MNCRYVKGVNQWSTGPLLGPRGDVGSDRSGSDEMNLVDPGKLLPGFTQRVLTELYLAGVWFVCTDHTG